MVHFEKLGKSRALEVGEIKSGSWAHQMGRDKDFAQAWLGLGCLGFGGWNCCLDFLTALYDWRLLMLGDLLI